MGHEQSKERTWECGSLGEVSYDVLVNNVLPLLDLRSLGRLAATCSSARKMCSDERLWHTVTSSGDSVDMLSKLPCLSHTHELILRGSAHSVDSDAFAALALVMTKLSSFDSRALLSTKAIESLSSCCCGIVDLSVRVKYSALSQLVPLISVRAHQLRKIVVDIKGASSIETVVDALAQSVRASRKPLSSLEVLGSVGPLLGCVPLESFDRLVGALDGEVVLPSLSALALDRQNKRTERNVALRVGKHLAGTKLRRLDGHFGQLIAAVAVVNCPLLESFHGRYGGCLGSKGIKMVLSKQCAFPLRGAGIRLSAKDPARSELFCRFLDLCPALEAIHVESAEYIDVSLAAKIASLPCIREFEYNALTLLGNDSVGALCTRKFSGLSSHSDIPVLTSLLQGDRFSALEHLRIDPPYGTWSSKKVMAVLEALVDSPCRRTLRYLSCEECNSFEANFALGLVAMFSRLEELHMLSLSGVFAALENTVNLAFLQGLHKFRVGYGISRHYSLVTGCSHYMSMYGGDNRGKFAAACKEAGFDCEKDHNGMYASKGLTMDDPSTIR